MAFDKQFEERRQGREREEARLHERFSVWVTVVDDATETGKTEGQMTVKVSVTHLRIKS